MKKNLVTATPIWKPERNIWQLNIQKDRIRKSFYSSIEGKKGYAECLQKAQKWIDLFTDGDPIVSVAWEEYIKHKEKTVAKAGMSTINSFGKKWLLPSVIAKKRMSKVAPIEWQKLLDSCRDEGLSQRTLNNNKGLILEFLRFCHDSRWIDEVPTGFQTHSTKPKERKHILQPSGVKTLFSVNTTRFGGRLTKEWFINMFRLAVVTGMRRGELAGLQWQDIEENSLTISRAINSLNIVTNAKNDNARRTVPLPQYAKDIIADQKELMKSKNMISLWVFPDETGKPCDPNLVYQAWKRYLRSNNLDEKITFHNLRRTMISMHKTDDMPLELLKQVVGHSVSMDTYGVYGEEVDGEIEAAAKFMDEAMKHVIG